MTYTRAFIVVLVGTLFVPSATAQAVASEVQVFVADQAALANLVALDLDLIPHEAGPGWVPVIVYGQSQLSALSEAEFPWQMVHPNLVAHMLEGLTAPETSGFPNGSMGGYFTFAEMVAAFDALVAAHPTLIAPKVSLGTTYEGRPIWMWKISDNPLANENEPEVYLDAMHHAREPGGMMSLYWFVKTMLDGYATNPDWSSLVNNREIFVVPCVNPDGYVYNQTNSPGGGGLWRKNRRDNGNGTRGVDLNRNYPFQWGVDNVGSSASTSSETYRGPSAASEAEVQAVIAFAQAHTFRVSESVHTYGGFHLYPFGYAANAASPLQSAYLEWGSRMSTLSGYRTGTPPTILYLANGVSADWWEGARGIPSLNSEFGNQNDGFWPPTARILPIAEENLPTFFEWSWIAGSHVLVSSVILHQVSGNGNAWPEPGETFDVEVVLRNVGTLGTTAVVPATAVATTPYAQVITGASSTPGAIASLSNGSVTFRISIAATAPRAAPIDLSVSWTFDGIARTAPVRLTAGPLIQATNDTFETSTGWTVGSPIDTGTGAWTRVNPNGTQLALVGGGTTPWQPEDDHTASGTQCWVTGNGSVGASVGSASVSGITTLTSPAYDLGQLLQPEIRVWIWFACDDHDDALTIELSNDDGTNWAPVEQVRGWKNAWTQHVWRLHDFLIPSSRTRIRFRASDNPHNSTTEAAIDDFEIWGYQPSLTIGATTTSQPIPFSITGPATLAGKSYMIAVSTSASAGIPLGDGRVAGIDDSPVLSLVFSQPGTFQNFMGTMPASGSVSALLAINNPALSGARFFATAVTYTLGASLIVYEISGTLSLVVP